MNPSAVGHCAVQGIAGKPQRAGRVAARDMPVSKFAQAAIQQPSGGARPAPLIGDWMLVLDPDPGNLPLRNGTDVGPSGSTTQVLVGRDALAYGMPDRSACEGRQANPSAAPTSGYQADTLEKTRLYRRLLTRLDKPRKTLV